MRAEHAEIKFSADSKLAEANALVASIEEVTLEIEAREKSIESDEKNLGRKRLLSMKTEVEKIRADNQEELQWIHEETNRRNKSVIQRKAQNKA
ncbi:hypothetical protein K1719_001174 [Acacia pycnantha]|nr:hypothetical protein K1719_001174 [Acacia pycnantha]